MSSLPLCRRTSSIFRGALASYRHASALGETARALIGNAFFLAEMGRAGEAMKPASQAVLIDPLNPSAYAALGDVHYFSRNYEAAIVSLRRMLEIAPKRYYAHYFIGLSLMWLGRPADAAREFRSMPADDLFRNTGEALLAARTGNRATSDQAIAAVRKLGARMLLIAIYAQRKDTEQAFALLDAAWAERSPDLSALRADRLYDPIRSDPRFASLMAKLNFP